MKSERLTVKGLYPEPSESWQRFISLLQIGEENAIHMKALADSVGMTTSAIRHRIRLLKRAGYPVCSSRHGYYIAKDKAELRQSVDAHLKATVTRFVTVKEIRRGLREDEMQMNIDGCDPENGNNLKGELS